MSEVQTSSRSASSSKSRTSRLFVLEINAGRIHSMKTDGTDKKTIVTDCRMPDGIVVDVEAGHIYWTNMGVPSANDGSIERADSMEKIVKSSFPKAAPLRQSRSTSIRRTASSTGAIARGCA
jgi:hypothetical protein